MELRSLGFRGFSVSPGYRDLGLRIKLACFCHGAWKDCCMTMESRFALGDSPLLLHAECCAKRREISAEQCCFCIPVAQEKLLRFTFCFYT